MTPNPVEQRAIEDFLSFEYPEQRAEWLRQKSEEGRRAFFSAFARAKDTLLEDVLSLPSPWRDEALFHFTGNNHAEMRIHPCGRSFTIAPTDSTPVRVENGTQNGKRQWLTISEPTPLETRKAINCLLQFGENAEHEANRGKLKQMTTQELGEWYSKQAQAQTQQEQDLDTPDSTDEGLSEPDSKNKSKRSKAK